MHDSDQIKTKKLESKERFISLQYLRGIAALMVVFTHSSVYLQQIYGYGELRLFFGDYWSYFGVIAFFCISGFLLTSLAMKTEWYLFLLHRCARIFPIYICALLLTLAGFWFFNIDYPQLDWRIVLLIPIGPEAYRPLHVEWTLIYEMAYYAILTIFCIFVMRKYLLIFYITWFVVLIFLFLKGISFGHHMLPNGWRVFFTAWNIAFIAGGVAWILSNGKNISWWVGIVGVVSVLCSTIHPMAVAFLAPAGISLLIVFFIHLERKKTFPFKSKILERFGNWSYALYLIHVPILLGLLPILLKSGNSPLSAWFCSLGIILLTGACLGELDLLMYRKLKKHIDMAFIRKDLDGNL